MMLEIIIERWSNRDASVDYLWSVWLDGQRREMGGPLQDAAAAEAAAREYCRDQLARKPDRVTHL